MPTCHLPRSVAALDVPFNCGCKLVWKLVRREGCDPINILVSPPCEHVLTADHGLSLEEWAATLLELEPDEYADRPDAQGETAATRQARVAVYAKRQRKGLSIFNPEDAWRAKHHEKKVAAVSEREEEDGSSRRARLANGRPNPEETLTTINSESERF